MTATELLSVLRSRGVTVEAEGDRLRLEPADRLDAAALEAVRTRKAELLAVLAAGDRTDRTSEPDGYSAREVEAVRDAWQGLDDAERKRLEAEAVTDPLARSMLHVVATDVAGSAVAWRVHSRRLAREVWLVVDPAAVDSIPCDHLPIVVGDDLARLEGLDDQALDATLDVLATFRGARLADLPDDDGGRL